VPRIPILSGSRLLLVNVDEGARVLAPPPPTAEPIADVRAAVRDALRFPLSGEPLAAQIPRGGRATIVAELPSLPLPGAPNDPRREALAATVDELRRCGVSDERQTILVAGGLARRAGRSELETLVSPHFALDFRGEVSVHDVEDPELADIGEEEGISLRASPALVETDAVVVVTAAETVLHGGPAALLAAGGAQALRAAGASSLLETGGSPGWRLALEAERALLRRVPVIGVSLALDSPRLSGALHGYPYDPEAVERIASSPLARAFRLVPAPLRMRVLRAIALELTASAAFAGPPSVAHAEALLRAIEVRSAELEEPLDAICVGIPRLTPHLPRERPNPLLSAYLGLGLALRLWREAFPVTEGGTVVLVHRFRRRFSHPTQQPYRQFFQAARAGPDPEALAAAEQLAATDQRALSAYREGRTCHPLLPFADWASCRPALERLGAVVVADCRDATAARQLGFVPTHGIGAALAMVEGRAGGSPRIGFLLSPPYFPIRVGARA
jgi:Lactate racemase N-terminal domain